jgi:peptide/nickel transport system substrate-binding protein
MKRWRDRIRGVFSRPDVRKSPSEHLAMGQVLQARETGSMPSGAQLKYFPKLLSGSEKRVASIAIIILIIAGGLLSLRLLNSQRIQIPVVGGEYTEGVIGAPQLINPMYALSNDVDSDLSRLIYSGLMRYDSNDGLVLDLAESMEVSEDETVYTFTIRKDATWHDGRPVLAEDVVFTVLTIQNVAYLSPLEVSFNNVRVEQVDLRTVRFVLDEAFAPFLSTLTVGLLPAHIWQDVSPEYAQLTELNKKPIGSGPYEFEKLVKDSKGIRSYTLKRNADYYGGAPYISRIHFKFYNSVFDAVEALRNKNVEGISYLPPEEVANFEKDGDVQIFFPSLAQYTAAFINQGHNAVLADDDVRMALSYATNKQELVDEALAGFATPIDSFILEGMVGEHPNVESRAFNLDTANSILEDAGWTYEEGSSVRSKDGIELSFEITTLPSEELSAVATVLAEQWSAIGANVIVKTVTSVDLRADGIKNKNNDILLSGELYGFDPDPYAFWHSSQTNYPGLNLSQFSNRNADDLIETGRSSTDVEERAASYRELQDLVAEEIAAVFLYQPNYPYVISKRIKADDIGRIVIPSDRLSGAHEWYIKTRKIIGQSIDSEG